MPQPHNFDSFKIDSTRQLMSLRTYPDKFNPRHKHWLSFQIWSWMEFGNSVWITLLCYVKPYRMIDAGHYKFIYYWIEFQMDDQWVFTHQNRQHVARHLWAVHGDWRDRSWTLQLRFFIEAQTVAQWRCSRRSIMLRCSRWWRIGWHSPMFARRGRCRSVGQRSRQLTKVVDIIHEFQRSVVSDVHGGIVWNSGDN